MNYKQYYLNQVGQGVPVFEGEPFQRGFGLGGAFRKFFKWVMPIITKHASPLVRTVGQEMIKGASNIALDSIEGKNFKESANNRFNESLLNIKKELQKGEGKRKKNLHEILFAKKRKNKKFKPDIFS